MKTKNLIAILATLLVYFTFPLHSYAEMRYASTWNKPVDVILVSAKPTRGYSSAYLDALLTECKLMISNSRLSKDFPNFYWERFKKCKICYLDGQYFNNNYILAEYNMNENIILVNATYLACSKETIIHELIHVLTMKNTRTMLCFKEGVAEYFTESVLNEYNCDYKDIYYDTDLNFLKILILSFGKKNTINMIMNGTIESKIDQYSYAGMGTKLEDSMLWINHIKNQGENNKSREYKSLLLVSEDILVNVARNRGRFLEKEDRNRLYRKVFNRLKVTNEYLNKLIEVE